MKTQLSDLPVILGLVVVISLLGCQISQVAFAYYEIKPHGFSWPEFLRPSEDKTKPTSNARTLIDYVADDISSASYVPLSSDQGLNGVYDDTLKNAGLEPIWNPNQRELFTEPRWSYNDLGQGTTQIPLYSGKPELIGRPYNRNCTPGPEQGISLSELRDRAQQQEKKVKKLTEERDRLKAEGKPPPNMLEPQAESPSRK